MNKTNEKMRIIISVIVLITAATGFCFISLYLTDWLYNPKGFNLMKYLFRDSFLVAAAFFFWNALLRIAKLLRNEIAKNILVLCGVFISLIILLEIAFSFVLLSGGGEKTLTGKNWFNYYWKENTLGYRDENPSVIDRAEKKNIFVVGDSYVAGHGLKKEEQRFSNILRNELKDCYDVFNLGVCGADTREEFDFLKSYPIKPDLVVLSYVNNDIYKITGRKEIYKILNINPKKDMKLGRFTSSPGFMNTHSYFLNFLNYILFESSRDKTFLSLMEKYKSIEKVFESEEGKAIELSYYANDSLMKLQLNNLNKFVEYSSINNIKLLVILFPISDERVIDYTNKTANEPIMNYFKQQGVAAINFTPTLKKIKPDERHVNKFDPHPGIYTNRIIADTIKKYLVINNLSDTTCSEN